MFLELIDEMIDKNFDKYLEEASCTKKEEQDWDKIEELLKNNLLNSKEELVISDAISRLNYHISERLFRAGFVSVLNELIMSEREEGVEMTRREKAKIMLDAVDRLAPTQVNWNMEKIWLVALETGLREIDDAEEKKKSAGVGAPNGR